MNYSAPECKLYKCVGDYNDGVQTIITPQEGCYLPTARLATTLEVAEVTPLMPTFPPLREIPDLVTVVFYFFYHSLQVSASSRNVTFHAFVTKMLTNGDG